MKDSSKNAKETDQTELTYKPVILVFPFDLLSHYSRCIQLADAISDEYDIRFVASSRYNHILKASGFSTFDCEMLDANHVLACARNFDFSWSNFADLKRIYLSQVACIQRMTPIAVIGDTAPTLNMAAETTNTRYVSLMNGYMTRYYAFVREIPEAHPAAKLKPFFPPKVFNFMIELGERASFKQIHRPFRLLRSKYSLSRRNMYLEEIEGACNLICDLPDFFPQRQQPASYHFIGPLYHEDDTAEPAVQQFIENEKKTLLLSVGSSGELAHFSFLKDPAFKEFNIVVSGDTTGQMAGDHILSLPFLNHAAVLKDIDLVICHGGNGIIYQALSFGIPLLCKTSIFEQEWNVQRLEQLGFGERLNIHATHQRLLNQIQTWIAKKSTPQFKHISKQIDIAASRQAFKNVWRQIVS